MSNQKVNPLKQTTQSFGTSGPPKRELKPFGGFTARVREQVKRKDQELAKKGGK